MSMKTGYGRLVLVIAASSSGCSPYPKGGFHISLDAHVSPPNRNPSRLRVFAWETGDHSNAPSR